MATVIILKSSSGLRFKFICDSTLVASKYSYDPDRSVFESSYRKLKFVCLNYSNTVKRGIDPYFEKFVNYFVTLKKICKFIQHCLRFLH